MKRGGSTLKKPVHLAPLQQSVTLDNVSRSRMKLPELQSKKHADNMPMPTLPFPRVLGKDVISPFPSS